MKTNQNFSQNSFITIALAIALMTLISGCFGGSYRSHAQDQARKAQAASLANCQKKVEQYRQEEGKVISTRYTVSYSNFFGPNEMAKFVVKDKEKSIVNTLLNSKGIMTPVFRIDFRTNELMLDWDATVKRHAFLSKSLKLADLEWTKKIGVLIEELVTEKVANFKNAALSGERVTSTLSYDVKGQSIFGSCLYSKLMSGLKNNKYKFLVLNSAKEIDFSTVNQIKIFDNAQNTKELAATAKMYKYMTLSLFAQTQSSEQICFIDSQMNSLCENNIETDVPPIVNMPFYQAPIGSNFFSATLFMGDVSCDSFIDPQTSLYTMSYGEYGEKTEALIAKINSSNFVCNQVANGFLKTALEKVSADMKK